MKRRVIIVVCLIAILVVVVAYVILSSHQPTSAPATQLFVEPETVQGTIGQDLTLNVSISNVTDLYGWEFYLGWNSSLLSLVNVNEGPFLKSGGNTYFTYTLNTTTTDEHVIVDCTLEGQIPGVSGNGTLATVTLNTTNAGECPLNLYNVDLRDSSDSEIPCQAVSGNFTSMLHDITVADVTASPTAVLPGDIVNVNVTVEDEGNFAEVFNLTAYANSQVIGTQQTSLNSGDLGNLSFTWNTTGCEKGDYNISASVSLAPGEVNQGNNTGIANTSVTILTPGHDIAVIDLILLKTVVGQGYSMSLGVTVKDYGVFSETFNVTAYANTTLVGTQMVTLASAGEAELLFSNSTVSMTKGNYTVSATAGPVSGQTNTSDLSRVDGWVIITIPGDINGDGSVDVYDAILLAAAFYSTPGSSNWNPNADINGDGVVDIYDAIIMAQNFGKTDL